MKKVINFKNIRKILPCIYKVLELISKFNKVAGSRSTYKNEYFYMPARKTGK